MIYYENYDECLDELKTLEKEKPEESFSVTEQKRWDRDKQEFLFVYLICQNGWPQ